MRSYLLLQIILLCSSLFSLAQTNTITFGLQADGKFVSSQGEDNIVIKTSANTEKLYKNLVSASLLYGALNTNQVVATDGENININPMTVWTPSTVWGDGHDRVLLLNVRITAANGSITIYSPILTSMGYASNMNASYVDAENIIAYWSFFDKNGVVKKAERLQNINNAVNKKLSQIIEMALRED